MEKVSVINLIGTQEIIRINTKYENEKSEKNGKKKEKIITYTG